MIDLRLYCTEEQSWTTNPGQNEIIETGVGTRNCGIVETITKAHATDRAPTKHGLDLDLLQSRNK